MPGFLRYQNDQKLYSKQQFSAIYIAVDLAWMSQRVFPYETIHGLSAPLSP